jgi:hypothetical protein
MPATQRVLGPWCLLSQLKIRFSAGRYGTPDEVKQVAVGLAGYGLSINAIGHLLGSCAQSVMRWISSYVDHTCPKSEPEPVPIIEVNEMWHYVYHNTNHAWIWKAYDKKRNRLID